MTNSSITRDRHFIVQRGFVNHLDKDNNHYQITFHDRAITVFLINDGTMTLICQEQVDVDEIIIDIDKDTNIVTIKPSYDKYLKQHSSVVKCEIHLAPTPLINRKEQEQQQQEQLEIAELFL